MDEAILLSGRPTLIGYLIRMSEAEIQQFGDPDQAAEFAVANDVFEIGLEFADGTIDWVPIRAAGGAPTGHQNTPDGAAQ